MELVCGINASRAKQDNESTDYYSQSIGISLCLLKFKNS